MTFRIEIIKTDGTSGSIECPDFSYVDPINTMREGYLKFKILNKTDLGLMAEGSNLKIYRDSSLEFYGEITDLERFSGGGIKVQFAGKEISMGRENGDYANSPWVSVASATIFSDIIGESSNWSAGTIQTGITTDFRARKTNSILNSLGSLKETTGQDLEFDDSNTSSLKVNVLDHRGSSSSIMTVNEGLEITNTAYKTGYPVGNDVRVYGKGDGDNQIVSETSHGQDASSKATYGTIRKIVYDSTVMTQEQANQLADALVGKYKLPRKIYTFKVVDPTLAITTGDVITINSPQLSLLEELRVTAVERGLSQNEEFLSIEVTNKEYSESDIATNKKLLELEKLRREENTYMQGSANTLVFSGMVNANSTAPLSLTFQLPEDWIRDEAGDIRVTSFKLDYDVDPFRKSVGTASESDVAPDVLNSSGNTEPGVSGSTDDDDANVDGYSGDFTEMDLVDSQSALSIGCSSGSWNEVLDTGNLGSQAVNTDLLVVFNLQESSGGPEDIKYRVQLDGDTVFESKVSDFNNDNVKHSIWIPEGANSSSDDIEIDVYPESGSINISGNVHVYRLAHEHDDGSYRADDHDHGDGSLKTDNHGHDQGSYQARLHNHGVVIGDAVSDLPSLNSTAITWSLQYWNGSTWTTKNTGSSATWPPSFEQDIDISDSLTYPDNHGYWRILVYTNSSDPDLVKAVIKLKHNLEP